MRVDHAAVALVIDRSGSMASIADDTRGGIKTFLDSQKAQEGEATMTVAQFDDQYEVIYDGDVKKIDADRVAQQFQPRGWTALLDAIGRTVIELGNKIEAMPEAERPQRKVVAILTDGQENSSKEFTIDKVRALIEAKQKEGWDFLFLGASLDTIQVAQDYGFAVDKTLVYACGKMDKTLDAVNEQVNLAREGKTCGFSSDVRTLVKG